MRPILEHFDDFTDPMVFERVDRAPRIGSDGAFEVPDRPGLGLSLDRDACAERPATGGTIFEDDGSVGSASGRGGDEQRADPVPA